MTQKWLKNMTQKWLKNDSKMTQIWFKYDSNMTHRWLKFGEKKAPMYTTDEFFFELSENFTNKWVLQKQLMLGF